MAVLIAVPITYDTDAVPLSAARREKAARYRLIADQKRCLCAGVALDEALKTVGLREQTAVILQDEHGKPYLADYPQVHFNISHSGDYAVCVLTDAPVGVDIEQRRTFDWERTAKRAFTAAQCEWLRSQPKEKRLDAFFGLWTEHESRLKQSGVGLAGLSDAGELPCRSYLLDGYYLSVCTEGAFPDGVTIIE